MVFQRKSSLADSRRFSISEWDDAAPDVAELGAVAEEKVGDEDEEAQDEKMEAAPQMDLGSIYDAIQNRKENCAEDDDGDMQTDCHVGPHVASSAKRHSQHHPRRSHGHMNRRLSLDSIGHFPFVSHRHDKDKNHEDALTVAPSSSASRTSYSSSAGTNIWTKLLGGGNAEGLWDGLNSKNGNVFDESDRSGFEDDGDDEEVEDGCGRECKKSARRCGLAWWYETRHFGNTVIKHPHILMLSLLAFGVVCGVGMAAINSEKSAYVKKQKGTARFVAQETAQWFSNEFRRAMLPLYSVQQGVIHSGYFNNLPAQIGNYPNLLIDESTNTPFTKRNVTGICDAQDMVDKWRSIVQPINADNDLGGIVVGYRLFPANVACLTEPHRQENSEGFRADDFPQGEEALLASDNVFGLDTGHSAFPLWKMITTDLFINKQFNIFGPFAMPPMSELICGHLAIWTNPEGKDATAAVKDENVFDPEEGDADAAFNNTLNIHGTQVEGAWGFVVNFLDWTKLKEKSDIYKRFSDCKLEFQLSRVGGATAPGIDSALLAESPKSHLLDDANSIVVETESLHGVWQNQVGSLSGWNPPWYPAAVAGVVLTSLILGFLTASTLVERQLHRNLLYKVMPRRAIAKLHRGQTVLEKFNLVTIFFSDIVGFTSMAGSMRPIQVMKMLNELYTELDKLVEKHSVFKVETIGDAYMVVGGAPDRVHAPLAAERVALFALEAIEFVKNFRTNDGDRIFIRAGLASGPTVAGVVGQAMPRYCFFGDTVNFASRMESTSKKMRIQCAEITYRLLRDAPNAEFTLMKRMDGDIAGVQIKGKGHQITYWIEKSSPRVKSHKVINIAPDIKSEQLSKFEESEEVTQDSDAAWGNEAEANSDDVSGYEECLRIMNSNQEQ